jgi:hypothetical protein
MARDPPLTMNETAKALGVSRRCLQDFLLTIPTCHLAAGRRKLFDDESLVVIRAAMRQRAKECHSNSSPQKRGARRTIASAGQNSESALTEALRLATGRSQPNSSPSGEPRRNVTPFLVASVRER